MYSKRNILIIVAHTDDEALGMAGTIHKHRHEGDNVFAISMTDGVGSRDHSNNQNVSSRLQAAMKSSQILDFEWVKHYSFPDNALDSIPLLELVKSIEIVKNEVRPSVVYSHSSADLNIDHRRVLEAVLIAFRPQPNEICTELRCFEIPSATDYGHPNVTGSFQPNLYVNISKFLEKKQQALSAYHEEMREYPHTRSFIGVENLAKLRGNQVGIEAAEAFQVLRKIEI